MMTPQDREAIRALATFWRSQATEAQSEFPVDPCGLEQPAALRRCAKDLDTILSSLTAAAPGEFKTCHCGVVVPCEAHRVIDVVDQPARRLYITRAVPHFRGFDDDDEQPSPTDGKAQEP
jgi:hypothetical protein